MYISSKVEPTISTRKARIIGTVKGSNLKKTIIAIKAGMVMANPPNAGVSLSWRAFSGLSYSLFFLLVLGLYVIPHLIANFPISGNAKNENNKPKRNIGQ